MFTAMAGVIVMLIIRNRDPSVSQFSLSGSWVLEQFKILIDEREEAKRNFELLKAEIGSINSGVGEASNSASKTQQKPSTANEAETLEIQSAATLTHEAKLASYKSQSLPVYVSDAVLPAGSATKIAATKPNLTPANIEPATRHTDRQRCSCNAEGIIIAFIDRVSNLLCVLPCAMCSCTRNAESAYADAPRVSYTRPMVMWSAGGLHHQTQMPVEMENLGAYGPEGVFELPSHGGGHGFLVNTELPKPQILDAFYGR